MNNDKDLPNLFLSYFCYGGAKLTTHLHLVPRSKN